MKAKEALVRRSEFPKPPSSLVEPPVISSEFAYTKITKDLVVEALITQAATKAPGPDKINFQVLYMIWSWDKMRITNMVYHAIRLGYHFTEWKKAQGVFLEKRGKRDLSLVQSYLVISLLNRIGKVIEKVIARELSQYCKKRSKLHTG